MRLFSALEMPDDVRHVLSSFRGGLLDAKWVEPVDFHVTLAFFGELGRPIAEELAQALAEIDLPASDLRLTGPGVFGADRPRAIVALAERTPSLMALEAAHRAAVERVGLVAETRKYTPHVTLARLRRTMAGEVAAWLSEQPVFRPVTWQAERFALFSSRTSRGGGPYLVEAAFDLRNDQAAGRTNSTTTS